MKLTSLTLIPFLAATSAFAHGGHVAPTAGHAHWELAVIPLTAIAAGILFWQIMSRRTEK